MEKESETPSKKSPTVASLPPRDIPGATAGSLNDECLRSKQILALTAPDEETAAEEADALQRYKERRSTEPTTVPDQGRRMEERCETQGSMGKHTTTDASDDRSISGESIPAPPAFRNTGHVVIPSRPGAFAVAGFRREGDDTTDDDEGEEEENLDDRTASDPREGNVFSSFRSSEFCESIQASVVGDGDDQQGDVEEGHCSRVLEEATNVKPLPPQPQKKESNRPVAGIGLCCILLLVGALVALGLTMALPREDTTNSDAEGLQQPPDEQPEKEDATSTLDFSIPYDNSTLHPVTIRNIMEDPNSPQHNANKWMLEDPHLRDYPAWRQYQRFCMAVIYYSTAGHQWLQQDHFLSYEVPECQWFSQSSKPCDEEGRLIVQDYKYNNLGGTIPMEIQVESTRIADYSHNNITGSLPRLIGSNNFEEVIFSYNGFVPYIVQTDNDINGAVRTVLKVDSNEFHTTFIFMSVFPNLQVLNLTNNVIGNTLPTEVLHTPHLTYLGLGQNNFEGIVPTELGVLSALKDLDISRNLNLQGTLPTELGLLSALVGLDISKNMGLTGTIPEEFGALESLTYFNLSGTSLSGAIPGELCARNSTGSLKLVADCSQLECC